MPEPPAGADRPMRPLGAPTDILRPTGRPQPRPSPTPRRQGPWWPGALLGLLPTVVYAAMLPLFGDFGPWNDARDWFWGFLGWPARALLRFPDTVSLGPLVTIAGIHACVIAARRSRWLGPFWIVVAVQAVLSYVGVALLFAFVYVD